MRVDSRKSRRILGLLDLDTAETLFEDLARVPYFVKSEDLTYVSVNPAMARLCGVAFEREMLGRRAHNYFKADLARRYEAMDKEILATGRSIANAVDLTLGSAHAPTWLVFSRHPVLDCNEKVVGVMASAQSVGVNDARHSAVRRLSRAVDYIRCHYNEPLAVEGIAAHIGVSASQLQRDFSHFFAMTPRRFQQKVRIERALVFLERGERIAEVAYHCGFSDHSAFSRLFRRLMGMSPGRYRSLVT